jgi:hypothetical protein
VQAHLFEIRHSGLAFEAEDEARDDLANARDRDQLRIDQPIPEKIEIECV